MYTECLEAMMQTPFAATKPKANLILMLSAAIALASCSSAPDRSTVAAPALKVDKPLAAGGSIEMHLDGGDYKVRASSDGHVRVTFTGNPGNATADLDTNGPHANLAIRDTPHSNFQATVEVPATAGLTIRLAGGNLDIAAITGNKDIDSKAGNIAVAIPDSNDYASVDASVTAGNIDAGPFGDSTSGVSPHLKWSGSGKYTLHISLGAGNLELKH